MAKRAFDLDQPPPRLFRQSCAAQAMTPYGFIKDDTMNDTTKPPQLTHATGAPVSDNVNIQTAGPRGPARRQGVWVLA
jgi:hypothetical protein